MAEYIKESAKEIPTNPDAIVTILLPVLASVIGTRSRIIVNPNTRYIVPFIIRSMIFAYIVTKCQEGMLNSQLLKIFELLKKKGEITSTDVKRFIWEFKSVPNGDINELLLSLVELSKAQQIPTKKGIKIKVM
ncbi:hypothetical protein [Cyanobacterium aponinum]|uniref:hypothetical protein n=1 Tax=Cyanobacterium aponinum TaxID=379064 RepID=UPI00167F4D93|nr:hypothetical protein [Cyanobacterium aponinum]